MDILNEITQNRFLLVLLNENEYRKRITEMIKKVKEDKTKICYVCISVSYTDVINDLEKAGIDTSNFYFIDTLSSHYEKQEKRDNCMFISGPHSLEDISNAVKKIIKEKDCSVLIFDTITSLLVYQETSSIVKFTHNILSEKTHENTKKVFIVLKDEKDLKQDNTRLTKDISMFADRTIDE